MIGSIDRIWQLGAGLQVAARRLKERKGSHPIATTVESGSSITISVTHGL